MSIRIMTMQEMTTQEVIDRLMAGSYKGQKITAVDFDPALSNICDLWLFGGKRVSFPSAVKACEWVTIEEIIWLAENAPNKDFEGWLMVPSKPSSAASLPAEKREKHEPIFQ